MSRIKISCQQVLDISKVISLKYVRGCIASFLDQCFNQNKSSFLKLFYLYNLSFTLKLILQTHGVWLLQNGCANEVQAQQLISCAFVKAAVRPTTAGSSLVRSAGKVTSSLRYVAAPPSSLLVNIG